MCAFIGKRTDSSCISIHLRGIGISLSTYITRHWRIQSSADPVSQRHHR